MWQTSLLLFYKLPDYRLYRLLLSSPLERAGGDLRLRLEAPLELAEEEEEEEEEELESELDESESEESESEESELEESELLSTTCFCCIIILGAFLSHSRRSSVNPPSPMLVKKFIAKRVFLGLSLGNSPS